MTAIAALPASTPRLAPPPAPPPVAPPGGRVPQLGAGRAPVALSDLGIKLSQQALHRSEQVGHRTIDLAQDFLNNFTRRYLGEGASVSFESADIDTASSLQTSGSHAEGPDGVVDTAAFSLNESAHFIGKGKITTADGQTFEFEIEVQYELSVEASSSRTAGPPSAPDGNAPPARALPPLEFGGDLSDLFKLLGRELHADVKPPQDGGDGGSLTLRLLKLIAPQLEQAGPTNDPAAAHLANNQALADSYNAA